MRYKITLAYDGRSFCGFQFQPNLRTIQGTLTDTLKTLLGDCTVTGCSRTDSGVHAKGFVALIDAPAGTVPVGRLPMAVNCILPPDISVIAASEAETDFHPRYSAHLKEYEYLINASAVRDPFSSGLVYEYGRPLDISKMNLAAGYFVGTHDFSGFMAAGSKITDTVRTVFSCGVTENGDTVRLNITGNGFLYNMVRIITGTLIYVSEGKIRADDIPEIIESKDRSRGGPTVPPCGLYLKSVTY